MFSAQACEERDICIQCADDRAFRRRSLKCGELTAHLLELRRDRFGVRDFLLRDLLSVFAHDLVHAPVQPRDGHLHLRIRLFTCGQSHTCVRKRVTPVLPVQPLLSSETLSQR